MERVEGIGGVFFRAKDPAALARWYHEALGVDPVPSDYDTMPWTTQAGITVFAPFAQDTTYFGKSETAFMVNFRVRDLDAMLAQLAEHGAVPQGEILDEPNGRFARIHDPEGNPIELWEPKGG